MDVAGTAEKLNRAVRNVGREGVASMAISAVDIALWDLKARLLDVPLAALIGQLRQDVPVYGSGGFITYDDRLTRDQLSAWVHDDQIPRVKIKIGESWGTNERRDRARVALGGREPPAYRVLPRPPADRADAARRRAGPSRRLADA